MSNVRDAECCAHCKKTLHDFVCRDRIYCMELEVYMPRTKTCDDFGMKEDKK